MVFHWRLSKNKSTQVSRILLSILTDLNSAVIWVVSIRPQISNSYSPLANPLGIVPRAPVTTHSQFTRWSTGAAKSNIWYVVFFMYPPRWGLLVRVYATRMDPREFYFVLWDRVWSIPILLLSMVKTWMFAQFPVYHSHSGMPVPAHLWSSLPLFIPHNLHFPFSSVPLFYHVVLEPLLKLT